MIVSGKGKAQIERKLQQQEYTESQKILEKLLVDLSEFFSTLTVRSMLPTSGKRRVG